jgi:hypothetical protein
MMMWMPNQIKKKKKGDCEYFHTNFLYFPTINIRSKCEITKPKKQIDKSLSPSTDSVAAFKFLPVNSSFNA